MAITREATSSGVALSAASATPSIPGTPLEGDLVIVKACSDGLWAATPRVTDGTTEYTYILESWGSNTPGYGAAYKIMGATPDTTVTIWGTDNRDAAYIIELWRGVDTTTPFDGVTPLTATGRDPSSLTTNTDGAVSVIDFYLDDKDDAGNGGLPSGYTGLVDKDTGNASSSAGATVATGYQTIATAGAIDPGAFTGYASDDEYTSHYILKPAPGGGGTLAPPPYRNAMQHMIVR